MTPRTPTTLLCFLALLAAPLTAGAQGETGAPGSGTPSVEDSAAERFFEAGRIAFNSGYYDQALRAFQEAYELSHRTALLYNIAVTLDRLERQREALDAYEQFLAAQPESDYARAVRSRVDIIRSHLPSVPETSTEPAEVTSDPSAAETSAPVVSSTTGADGPGLMAPAIGTLVVGGLGLLTFGVAAPIGLARHDAHAASCAPHCSASALDEVRALAITADVGLGVGLLSAAVGAVLLGIELSSPRAAEVVVVPSVTSSSAGLTAAGRF